MYPPDLMSVKETMEICQCGRVVDFPMTYDSCLELVPWPHQRPVGLPSIGISGAKVN
jgi:hypothetical protein